jgi:hypothetical protein
MFKNSKANDIFIKEMMEIIIYTCDVKHSFHVSNTGADPEFQVRGGALKKIAPSGRRHEHFLVLIDAMSCL